MIQNVGIIQLARDGQRKRRKSEPSSKCWHQFHFNERSLWLTPSWLTLSHFVEIPKAYGRYATVIARSVLSLLRARGKLNEALHGTMANSQLEPKTRQYAELSRFLFEEPKLIDVTWHMPSVMGICSDLWRSTRNVQTLTVNWRILETKMTVTDSISRHAASSLSRPGGKIKSWLPHCWHFHWFHLGDLKFFFVLHRFTKAASIRKTIWIFVTSCFILLHLITVV